MKRPFYLLMALALVLAGCGTSSKVAGTETIGISQTTAKKSKNVLLNIVLVIFFAFIIGNPPLCHFSSSA